MTMNNKMTTFALMGLLASTTAFTSAPRNGAIYTQVSSTAFAGDLPYFIDVTDNSRQEEGLKNDETPSQSAAAVLEAPPKASPKKDAAPKKGGAVHQEGIFSPVVLAAKAVLGDEHLNKVRAKAISIHSDVIASFVETYNSPAGQAALKTLFRIADKDGNGVIDENELSTAFETIGFTWLKEKQVKGIIKRADTDENGAIDLQEFMNEAPKTLRTNLTKLAKKNGGELGFLV